MASWSRSDIADLSASFGGSVEARDRMATKLFIWFHSKRPPGDADEFGVENRPQLRKGRRWRSSHWNR